MKINEKLFIINAKGKCIGIPPNVFYPEVMTTGRPKKGQAIRDRDSIEGQQLRAAEICNGTTDGRVCPVRDTCLEFALETNQRDGVWGGMTETERHKLKHPKKVS